MTLRNLALLLLAALLPATSLPGRALAWGHTAHREITALAMAALPHELPEFLRSPEAVQELAALGPELDMSKGAGSPHDAELDPGHYVNLDDEGRVLGILPLERLPRTREAYDTALRAGGQTQYNAGYLPYSLLVGWQQLQKDFGYVRAATAALRNASTQADRAWLRLFLQSRQRLTIRDLGVWSHYVADASQPLHVSVHYNGWGNHPNPNNYSQDRRLHAEFEGRFVRDAIRWPALARLLPAYRDCGCAPADRIQQYLRASLAQVEPLYRLEQQGAFQRLGSPEGVAFTQARLVAAAAELRDLVTMAWRASAESQVGYPPIPVAEIEAGRVRLTRHSLWQD